MDDDPELIQQFFAASKTSIPNMLDVQIRIDRIWSYSSDVPVPG
tara:strand:+ start:3842 stop:3973 length:132 start_codon:yes stop_codon:yes gene_type:complete